MASASEIARQLQTRFLLHGNFVFAGTVGSAPFGTLATPAAAVRVSDEVRTFVEESGFAGLAVQSVGYEAGGDTEPVVHIYVTRGSKRAEHEIMSQGERVRIEVERIGRVIVRPETAAAVTARGNLYVRKNRIACGSSCAPASEQLAGTFGALVQKAEATGAGRPFFAVSNNHVFACGNHTPADMPILAPAPMDAGPNLPAPTEICRHFEICELRSGDPAFVQPVREDVAIGRVVNPAQLTSWQGDNAEGFDTPSAVMQPRSGVKVKKFGRTTGLTTGVIQSAVLPFPLPYRCKQFTATVWLQDTWVIRAEPTGSPFALPGDSGSLVTDEAAKNAVGLVFAASPSGDHGFIIPMSHVVQLFGGLKLVSKHGT